MLQRRLLPIVEACPRAQAVQPVADGVGWCEDCRLHVHDLSAGTELEARMLVRAHGRERLCVAYRTRADGTIAFREQAKRFAFSTAIGLLVACTGHAPVDVAPELVCRDADGREQLCPEPVELPRTAVVPEEPPPVPVPAPLPEGMPSGILGIIGQEAAMGGALRSDDEDVWGALPRVDPSRRRAPSGASRRPRRVR